MTAPVDYYALLGVPRAASPADMRSAYKLQERIWRKRAASSSESSISAEATRRLALLAEAMRVLSDPQQRAAYDRQSIAAPPAPAPSASLALMSSGNLIERAEGYLAVGDYYAAAGAAREATQTQGNEAESWFALSRANAGLGRLDDAVYEARRAIELASENPECHFNLGTILEEAGKWDNALGEYQQAAQLSPDEPLYQLAIGGVWLARNQPDKALPIIERVYSSARDHETACYYYAQALIAAAEAVPRDKSKDGFAVTSVLEIQRMRDYLRRTASINHLDQETRQTIRDTEAYLQRMEGNTFNIPIGAKSTAFELLDPSMGCMGMFVMAVVLGLVGLAPLWLALWGFAAMGNGSVGGGFLLLLIGGGLGYIWYRQVWVPRWKVNSRLRDHRIRYQS